MNFSDRPDPQPVFDEPAVQAILNETGLPLARGQKRQSLQEELERIALEYYWEEFSASEVGRQSGGISFDVLADSSVTPSRLKKRLEQIERSAKRVFAGASKRPLVDKVEELLKRLGVDRGGRLLRISGTELLGHGGSERSAVRFCLVRAITAIESPPQGYRSNILDRPWASQRFDDAVQALITFAKHPEHSREYADEVAHDIHHWAGRSIEDVQGFLAPNMARHKGEVALDLTLRELAETYKTAFDENPPVYWSSSRGGASPPNPWIRFVQAVLKRILEPEEPPSISAIEARWRHLKYDKQKIQS